MIALTTMNTRRAKLHELGRRLRSWEATRSTADRRRFLRTLDELARLVRQP